MRLRKKQALRIVSLVLAASMALSAFPTAAFAAGTPQKTEAENSAVETQAEDSQDKEKSYTLSIKDGKPEGKGNKTSGWTYDSTENRLTIYKGFEFEFGTQTVDCSVWNEGTIKNGVFSHGIDNYGTVENSKFTSFKTEDNTYTTYGVSNSGMMIDVVDESDNTYNQYNGVIDGGKFGYIDNHNLVKNADIKKLHFSEGGSVENCVFGMWSGEDAPENAYVLTFSADATVNDFISVEPDEWDESSKKIFVVGNREVLVKYNGDAESFGGWKVTPEVEMEKVDDITVKFVNLTSDITLSATEKAVELTFDEDGYPVGKGNKTSGWTYDGYTLKFYEGYTFSQDVIVNCSVENAGTITDGTFTKGVSNYIWADGEKICGTITGGIFAGLSIASDENMPENMYVLAAINSKINGVIDDAAEIVGENRKVTVTANLSDDEFESWNDVSDIGIDTDSKTLEFVMPSQNVILRINYKDRPLVIDEEGKPTCTGGKNWEYFERNDQVYLYDGYEFESTTPVSVMVVAYPGATIKNGIFDGTVTSLGTIKDGTFNGFVNNVGVIEGGTFNDEVMNLTIDGAAVGGEYSDIPKCEGVIRGGTFNGLVSNGSKLEGGTFNNFVVNTQNLAENMETGADAIGVISDGTFENEVVNLSTIEGGNFRKKVTNIGTISNGAFWSGVENTTYENLNPDSMSDHVIATMSLIETESFAIDMQNDASTTENYVGSITSGAFFGTVENKGGKITGGVFHSQLRGDAVENVHVLNAVDARIGTDVPNYNNTHAVFENTVYVVGQQGVYVRYVGEGEFGSWKSEDVELSTENMSADGKTVTFTMPGDKDVTLTVSTEKPVKPVVTYAVTVKNGEATVDGNAIEKAKKGDTVTITANAAAEGKEFAGWKVIEGGVTLDDASKTTTTFEMGEEAVTVEATYKDKTTKPTEPTKPDKPSEDTTITVDKDTKLDEDKIYDKDVKNDGIISKGEFTGEVTNNGTIENGTFTDTVTNNGTIKNGKFAGEVKGKGKIEGGTFQQVTEASEISGGVFGAQSDMSNAKVVPSTLKIESSVADSSLVNDVIGNGAAQALALFAENDIATQAADSAEMVAYVVGNQTLTVKYTGTDKSFDKWDTTGLDGAKLSEDGKTITFTMKSGAGDVTLKSVQKKDDTKPTEPTKPEVKTYAVTVKNGKATVDGKAIEKAKKGDVVTITANAAAEGKEFAGWKVIEGGVTLDDESKTTTTFTMGEEAVTVEATYKDKTTAKPTEPTKPTEPDKKDDDGMGALIVGGVIVAGGIATGVVVYNVAMDYIKSALPEGAAIPETREQLAVALWENAGKPEVVVEEGVVLTDTEKAMRWATENKLVSADGSDSVSKFDVLVAVYKAKNL